MANQKSLSSANGQIHVRPYEDRDSEQVRDLVIRGYIEGRGSSMQTAIRSLWWEPICAITYPLAGLGLAFLFKYAQGLATNFIGGLVISAIPILWVKFWQRKYSQLWLDHCQELLKTGDLADIGKFYRDNDDGGVSGFWVAVTIEGGKERVVGCAGLVDSRGHSDKSCSELQRVSVAEDYRRRGLARLLANAAISHAREKSLGKVTLWSTTYQANAHFLYKSLGFVEVKKERLGGHWIRNGWGHTMELEL